MTTIFPHINVSSTLTMLLDASIRCVLLFALAGAVCWLLRNRSAALRHGVWTTAVVLALLLPVFSAVLPSWRLSVLPDVASQATSPTTTRLESKPMATISARQETKIDSARKESTPAIARRESLPAASSTEEVPAVAGVETTPEKPSTATALRAIPVSTWILIVWAVGAVGMFVSLLAGTIGIRRVARKSRHITDPAILAMKDRLCEDLAIRQPVLMLQSDESFVPVTWGIWWPTVLLPREAKDWSPSRLRMVLLHELAHVKRDDCMTQLFVQLARAMYWFHPLIWWAAKNLRIQRERACDDLVLAGGVAGPDYADQLLQIVRSLRSGRGTPLAAVAMARKSQFESRLLSVLDEAKRRGGLSRKVAWAILTVALAVALPLAALQPVARADSSKSQKLPDFVPPTSRLNEEGRIVDKLDYPFANDPAVLGQWESVDFVSKIKDFDPKDKSFGGELYLKEMVFREDGKTHKPFRTWTKGLLFHSGDKTASRYTIKKINGTPYLFLEWKSGDYTIRHQKPKYYVLKKTKKDGKNETREKEKTRDSSPALQNPCVVKTSPTALANDVDPKLKNITVTFDQPMMDRSWSWTGGGDTYPKTTGRPRYDEKRTTCTLPVKLQPGKVYWVGINSPSYKNFKTKDRKPAKRYAILFATKSAGGKPTPIPENMLRQARRINGARAVQIPDAPEKPSRKLLDEQTRREVARFDRMFAGWFDVPGRYELASEARKKLMVKQWMKEAQGDDFKKRTQAIAMLGNVKAQAAVDVLIEIAEEPMHNCRPKWLAARALGEIGDIRAVPTLIGLVDHGNTNTRVYARASLAEITGVYFGDDKDKWAQWWKQHAPKDTGEAEEDAPSKAKLINWVEKFFSQNYRDITARKTLQWGEPEKTPDGNLSIRYKCLATIWDKKKMVLEKRFTFTPKGKFVSAETIEQKQAENDKSSLAPKGKNHTIQNPVFSKERQIILTSPDISLTDHGAGSLETGKTFSLQEIVKEKNPVTSQTWMTNNAIQLSAGDAGRNQGKLLEVRLIGWNMAQMPAPSREYDSATPKGIQKILEPMQPPTPGAPRPIMAIGCKPGGEKYTAAFKTQNGTCGIFQVTKVTPTGKLYIRYKLIKANGDTTMAGQKADNKLHYYCLETGKEFALSPAEAKDAMGTTPGKNGRYFSPFTQKRTAVAMTLCPNCKKYFVPDYLVREEGKEPPTPGNGKLICPFCKTDVVNWYRQHRRNKATSAHQK